MIEPKSNLAKLRRAAVLVLAVLLGGSIGCTGNRIREDLDYDHQVEQVWDVPEVQFGDIVQFETVFWEPDDTASLRKLIVEDSIASGRSVLEIGTGTGLISILCAQYMASEVLATDINPAAVANARYNAAMVEADDTMKVRLVKPDSPGAFSIIPPKKKFDLIISNPPWEDGKVNQPADYAFYDPNFALMDSLLDGLPQHLAIGGRCLLAYGHRPAIERLKEQCEARKYQFKILDDRKLDDLEKDFLPGMLVEIRMPNEKVSAKKP